MTTAVLVHGGWHSASCWDLVRAELASDGIRSVAPQLPMTSTLDVDAAVVRKLRSAAGAPNVRHLIYIAATMIEAGHPTRSPFSVQVAGRETLRPKVVIETGTTTVIDREVSLAAFYHDVEPSLARQAACRLRPFQKTGYAVIDTDAVAAWRTIPTTYVVCAEDRMIHPDTQREMAAVAGAEVLEWPSSHSPFLSHPDLVADLVARRAERASG
jgi:pimeloyl-ACP methyl ester carboxylesterase